MSNESTINFVFVSRLNDGAAEIRIETNSRSALQDALLSLGLASASQFANGEQESKVAAPAAEPAAEAKPKKAKAAKAEAASDVVAKEEAKTEAPAPTAEPEAEVKAAEAATGAPSATVEEAAAAVRAFGAKNGLQAARDLLQRFGFARTTEVTADKAGEIVAAAAL